LSYYLYSIIWVFDYCFTGVVQKYGAIYGHTAMLPGLPFNNRLIKLSECWSSSTKTVSLYLVKSKSYEHTLKVYWTVHKAIYNLQNPNYLRSHYLYPILSPVSDLKMIIFTLVLAYKYLIKRNCFEIIYGIYVNSQINNGVVVPEYKLRN